MATKVNKSTSTSKSASSKKSGESKGPVVIDYGPWARKCIKWLAEKKPPTTIHPLNNPKLLSKIINSTKHNYHDLRNWRLVNRLFREVTLDPWRLTATLVILPDVSRSFDESITIYLSETCPKSGATMSELLQNLADRTDPYDFYTKPFRRVKLRGMHMEDEMQPSFLNSNDFEILNVLPRVLNIIGLTIAYLHVDHCKFENTMKYGAFHKLLLEKVQFMNKLVITNCIFKENVCTYHPHLVIRYTYNIHVTKLKVCGDFPMPFACLLTFLPNLQQVKLRQGKRAVHQNRHYFSHIISPFSHMRKFDSHYFKITKLDVMDTDTFRMGFNPTRHFRIAQLPLETLSVEISPFLDCDPQGINNKGSDGARRIGSSGDIIVPMLREHKETLKKFKIFRPPFSRPLPNFSFTVDCEQMKELRIWGNVVENLNILKNMPNLEILYVNTLCYDRWEQMNDLMAFDFPFEYQPYQGDILSLTGIFHRKSFVVKLKQMKELTLELSLGEESIKKLSKWMPNLRTFRSVFSKEAFRTTCATMPELDELGILYGSEVDNDAITGIYDKVNFHPDNLRRLGELKRLKIDGYCGKSDLRDSAVYLTFLHLRALQFVQICVSKEMTIQAEEDLKRFVRGPVIFIRNYDESPHDNYDCCKRTQFLIEVIGRIPRPTAAEFNAAHSDPNRCDGSCHGSSCGVPNCPVHTHCIANCPLYTHTIDNCPLYFHSMKDCPIHSHCYDNCAEPSNGRGNRPGPSLGSHAIRRSSRGNGNLPGTSRGARPSRSSYRN